MEEGRVTREVSRDEIRSKREMIIEELKPYIYCIFCNFCWAGFNIVSKISLNNGMSQYVLSVYGQIIGVFTLAILAFLFERNSKSKINLPILRDIFFLGLLGTGIARTLFFLGLEYTSPALVGAMSNLVPSITFILAVLCRMEKVDIYKLSTQAKILGSLVAFGGAAMLTLYKGIVVVSFHKNNFLHSENKRSIQHGDNWIKGSIFLLFSYCAMAAFYIFQTSAIKKYPAPITLTLHTSLCGGLFAIVIAAIEDHEPHSWRLSWNIALLAPIFNGIMIIGLTYYVQTLVVRRRGPVFMTAFRPLSTIISAIMGLLLLGDALHLGGILGATLIVVGLYAILWGKEKEKDKN